MKRLAVFLSLACLAAVAWGQQTNRQIDQTIDADPNGTVEVINLAGDITIVGWDRNEVHVAGELAENAERLDLTRDGDRVRVEVVYPDGFDSGGPGLSSDDTDLMISVPAHSFIEVNTVSADVVVSDVEGEQNVNTVSGDVITQMFAAEIHVESVSGDVEVMGQDSKSRMTAESVSGDVSLDSVSGQIDAQSVSGDVAITSQLIERAELQSVSGDITVHGELAPDARFNASTTSGDVELYLRGSVAGNYRLATFSGEIANCFGPKPTQSRAGPPNSTLRFDEGEGNLRVALQTMSGDIDLCRE